jgi:hypothetical protein
MNNTESVKNVHSIFPLSSEIRFSQDEAIDLIGALLNVTSKAKNKINAANGHVQFNKNNPNAQKHHQEILNTEIQKWSEKMRRLGVIPLSLFQVKISAKVGGYYTWEFPSDELVHYED